MENTVETACRICGLDDGESLYEDGFPRYVICECCYNESGIGDDTVTQVRELGGYWVGHGAQWHKPQSRPADWDLLSQLANIPPEWR
ncbi:hypothetical protein [Streptomyces albidoflavus]|uniref:hypothetical protein n=1 Tax=Streptomyces albidoflavus TaxID=1886 RepID=UPI00101EEDC0|nr:hypothetical protein [Streptomyces albidoflavus]RZF10557.1 hypothetical protein C0R05_00360 [Streptomyces albidoflavus]